MNQPPIQVQGNQAPQAEENPPYSVTNAMVLCGVDNTDEFNGKTAAQRFAEDIFSNSFQICMDKTVDEVQNDLKQYSSLTQTQGQIRVNPGVIQRIHAFIQWSRDMIRTDMDPALSPFPVHDTAMLLTNYKSHQAFIDKSKMISDAAKPTKFKENNKWDDWYPTFLNFLRAIPGRNGIPLNYICREDDEPAPNNPEIDFIENYILQAPVWGTAFKVDAAEVHTYLVNFTSGNSIAEVKMLPYAHENNGRLDFKALKEHYEGVGVNSINVIKAEETLKNLFYAGERKPHMWWDEFEKLLSRSFTIIHKNERREVYSNEMKLRILIQKINVDFLQGVKAAMSIELSREPLLMTYEQAVMTFRNEVNSKFPPSMSSNNNRTRRINEMSRSPGNPRPNGYNSYGRGRGRGRGGRFSGRGRNGPNGRGPGRGRGQSRGHPDARFVTGTNGRTIEIHPSYNFPTDIWNVIPYAERKRIIDERTQYSNNKRQRISTTGSVPPAINFNNNQAQSTVGSVAGSESNNQPPTPNQYQISSIMGGRNEQASMRSVKRLRYSDVLCC